MTLNNTTTNTVSIMALPTIRNTVISATLDQETPRQSFRAILVPTIIEKEPMAMDTDEEFRSEQDKNSDLVPTTEDIVAPPDPSEPHDQLPQTNAFPKGNLSSYQDISQPTHIMADTKAPLLRANASEPIEHAEVLNMSGKNLPVIAVPTSHGDVAPHNDRFPQQTEPHSQPELVNRRDDPLVGYEKAASRSAYPEEIVSSTTESAASTLTSKVEGKTENGLSQLDPQKTQTRPLALDVRRPTSVASPDVSVQPSTIYPVEPTDQLTLAHRRQDKDLMFPIAKRQAQLADQTRAVAVHVTPNQPPQVMSAPSSRFEPAVRGITMLTDKAEADELISVRSTDSASRQPNLTQILGSGAIPSQTSAEARAIASQIATHIGKGPENTTVLRLDPEELGHVRMTLKTSEHGITMTIIAERSETSDIMRRHIQELADEFRSMGFDNLNFTFGGQQAQDDAPVPQTIRSDIGPDEDVDEPRITQFLQQSGSLNVRL